jgi:hypothetical protein
MSWTVIQGLLAALFLLVFILSIFFILLNVMASQTQHSLVSGLILEIGSKMSGKKSGFDVYTICLS